MKPLCSGAFSLKDYDNEESNVNTVYRQQNKTKKRRGRLIFLFH